jgi:hypothetical protein
MEFIMKRLSTFASLHLCVKKSVLLFILFTLITSLVFAQESYRIKDKRLNEVSGIVASRINTDLYYVHNDSGGKNEVYVINGHGKTITTLILTGATDRDWEDIAIGPGPEPGRSYVYVGEIGDNDAKHKEVALYRFPEPNLQSNAKKALPPIAIPAAQVEKLSFTYADGPKDCEALFIDPDYGDIYLVSKREKQVGLYQITAPLDHMGNNIAIRILSFDFPLAVAADISVDRKRILIKTYSTIYCWNVSPKQSISDALSAKPGKLPYKDEPQGEAICWSADDKHYLTISEKSGKAPLYLYVYP